MTTTVCDLRARLAPVAFRFFTGGWWRPNFFDEGELRRLAVAWVVVHWVVCGVLLLGLLYQPRSSFPDLLPYCLILATLVVAAVLTQFLVSAGHRLRLWFLLALYVVDVAAVSAGVAFGPGFDHDCFYLFYFPAVAASGILFSSLRVNLACCTLVAASYVFLCSALGGGVDLGSQQGGELVTRVAVMYLANVVLTLSCGLERKRWRECASRERFLLAERAEFSRSVHNTTAQMAYVVSLGLDSAVASVGEADSELRRRLQATSRLARSMAWQLRQVVNMGCIYEGEGLESAVRFHSLSFTDVTSVPAEFVCYGSEPELPAHLRRAVFTVAHNALANAYRHANATRVLVELSFPGTAVRLVVSDDGRGLPANYAERGYGFRNMALELEGVGGRLLVQRNGPLGGATVGCEALVAGG